MAKDEWLTVNEAAKISGYHPEYVRQLIRDGKVIAKKFSIVWMVSKESLLEYVKAQEKPPQK
jgi:excisionase family DNA binding protein